MHVTIDGYGGDPVRLADADLVREVLDRYPERIQMTKISTPHVQRYVGDKPQDWGVSGFVLIAESHISIHTFPEHRHVWIDVFSCKGFDASVIIDDVRRDFGLSDIQTHFLERGLEYPHSVTDSLPLCRDEREQLAVAVGDAR